jgi:hypothetical protein
MRLILHAGTHKTGTTTIQKVLHDNREWLSDRGLVFPATPPFTGTRAHLNFSHALAAGGVMGRSRSRHFIASARRNARPGDTVIISAEPIYRHLSGGVGMEGLVGPDYLERRRAYLRDLTAVLSDFDVEVVLYFRDYAYFLGWLYRTLRRRQHWKGSPARFRGEFGERFAYDRQIALFAEHFPKVRTFDYEAARATGLVAHFFDSIGFPMPPGADTVWERPTKVPVLPI